MSRQQFGLCLNEVVLKKNEAVTPELAHCDFLERAFLARNIIAQVQNL